MQKLTNMGFTERLKAAMKGTKEMRAILIRDPNKMISAAVLSSPKVTEQEAAGFARMASVSEDVLRAIGHNRAWMKNYSVVLGLTKNPKTPLAMSLNLMSRLQAEDVQTLSVDRNVPEPLRIAARKKVVANPAARDDMRRRFRLAIASPLVAPQPFSPRRRARRFPPLKPPDVNSCRRRTASSRRC